MELLEKNSNNQETTQPPISLNGSVYSSVKRLTNSYLVGIGSILPDSDLTVLADEGGVSRERH